MTRRMIDLAFWESESIAIHLNFFERLLFLGLLSHADDQGRLKAHATLIRSRVFPYDDIPVEQIETALRKFVDFESVILYDMGGKQYLQFTNWWRWQRLRWAWPSELPPPPGWADRHHYRQGNTVVKSNWDRDEADPAPNVNPVEPTVAPERNHSEPTVAPAPRVVVDPVVDQQQTQSSDSSSSLPGPDPPASAATALLLEAGFDPAVAQELSGRPPDDVRDWIAEGRRVQERKPDFEWRGLVVKRLRDSVQPPRAPPQGSGQTSPDRRRFIEGEYADYIEH